MLNCNDNQLTAFDCKPVGNLSFLYPVSYTHLDVYKRQAPTPALPKAMPAKLLAIIISQIGRAHV